MIRLYMNVSREILRSTKNVQKLTYCKFSRVARNMMNVSLKNNVLFDVQKHSRVPIIYVIRHKSTDDSKAETTVPFVSNSQENSTSSTPTQQINNTTENINTAESNNNFISEIPDPPIPPIEEVTNDTAEVLTTLSDPTFTSLGLGGYGPIGLTQYFIEWLHVSCDLPWWGAITVLCLITKAISIPLILKSTRENVKMYNIMPKIVEMNSRMTQARLGGEEMEAAAASYELQRLQKEHGISIYPYGLMFVRMFINIIVFMSLRGITASPIESLKTGGLWWFTDLTVADPYCVLPILSSVGIYLMVEHSMKTTGVDNTSLMLRYLMRASPVFTLFFALYFPGGVVYYWSLMTILTIIQNELFRIEKVKTFFNIPPMVEHKMKQPKKGFQQTFYDSWTNMRITSKLANHRRSDQYQFNDAGKCPYVITGI